jgi:hypothetical protein
MRIALRDKSASARAGMEAVVEMALDHDTEEAPAAHSSPAVRE